MPPASASARRVTIRDVAEATGVSRATVSFVLNETPGQTISAATQDRVRHAAEQLGYVPHGIARALAEGVSRIVMLSTGSHQDGHYARSFISGLGDELAVHDHVLLVRYAEKSAQAEQHLLDVVAPRAVVNFGAPYEDGTGLEDAGGGWRDGLAAHVATQISYLVERGHSRIGLALPQECGALGDAHLRFAGLTAERLGIRPIRELRVVPDRAATVRLLRSVGRLRPALTAIAAFDDATALRVLAAMNDLDLSAPSDLSVIGYDETDFAALVSPALTTVHIDAEAHGRIVARAVLQLPHDDLDPEPGRVVVRETA